MPVPRKRPYVGFLHCGLHFGTGVWQVFMSDHTPTETEYTQYTYVIGPWHTKRDAQYWASNPAMPMYNSLAYRAP
jgi:hypothetical protein